MLKRCHLRRDVLSAWRTGFSPCPAGVQDGDFACCARHAQPNLRDRRRSGRCALRSSVAGTRRSDPPGRGEVVTRAGRWTSRRQVNQRPWFRARASRTARRQDRRASVNRRWRACFAQRVESSSSRGCIGAGESVQKTMRRGWSLLGAARRAVLRRRLFGRVRPATSARHGDALRLAGAARTPGAARVHRSEGEL